MTLHALQTENNRFTIAACDQRASLAKLLGVDPQTTSGIETLKQVKNLFMEVFSPICSAVLTDPEFGLPRIEKKSPNAGLLLSLESSPYDPKEAPPENLPPLYPHWGVPEIAEHGAAVKLLLFYHPHAPNSEEKREWVGKVFGHCQAHHIPFVFEPLVYTEAESTLSLFEAQLQTAKDFTHLCDVLKLEFPVSVSEDFSSKLAAQRCKTISEHVHVPWIVLSRGMGYERFILAIDTAMKNGASGFAVGRAVWKELGEFPTWKEQEQFVRTTAKDRMKKLISIVQNA